jgi:hypothetical protein
MPRNSSSRNVKIFDTQDQWVQCDACKKWRIISSDERRNLPDVWVCEMNLDTQRNNCQAEEEPFVEDKPIVSII